MKRLSSFTHSRVALTSFPLWGTKEDILNNVLVFFFGPYNECQWGPKKHRSTFIFILWTETFFKSYLGLEQHEVEYKMTESYLMLLLLWTYWLVCDCTFCIATTILYLNRRLLFYPDGKLKSAERSKSIMKAHQAVKRGISFSYGIHQRSKKLGEALWKIIYRNHTHSSPDSIRFLLGPQKNVNYSVIFPEEWGKKWTCSNVCEAQIYLTSGKTSPSQISF